MNTTIHAKLDSLSPRFHPWAENRIRKALGRWSRTIIRVRAFLVEEEGPAVRCRVVVEAGRNGSLVATGLGGDAEVALGEALQRASHRVRRKADRRVARLRSSGRRSPRKAA